MQNRTNRISFSFSIKQELKDLLKGKSNPGSIEYVFGTYQATARWLKENKTAKRLFKKAENIVWENGDGPMIAFCQKYTSSKEEFMNKVDEILSSDDERRLDEEYLEHWKTI